MKALSTRRQPPKTGRHSERSPASLREGRSEESLTVTCAEAVGGNTRSLVPASSVHYFQRLPPSPIGVSRTRLFTAFPPAFARREFRSE